MTSGRATIIAVALLAAPAAVLAQTDEIQVYDGSMSAAGVINLTWHNNFTASGRKEPVFAGGIVPDRSLNGVAEWAYGVHDRVEAGLYLPLYSFSRGRGATFDGAKLRLLVGLAHGDDRRFFAAVNFELSANSRHWDPHSVTAEIRPIFGMHVQAWDLIVNPILDTSFAGGVGGLDFAPGTRLACHFAAPWTVAIEEYADLGLLRALRALRDQEHQIWGVLDYASEWVDVEAGVGFGLTSAADRITAKLMLSRDI